MGLTKTTFKAEALEHFRRVQTTKNPVIITDRGKPVLKVVPYSEDPEAELVKFRGLLVSYADPMQPVGVEDWQVIF